MAQQVDPEGIDTALASVFLRDMPGLMIHPPAPRHYWEKKSASWMEMEHQGGHARIGHRTARHQEFPRHNRNRFS